MNCTPLLALTVVALVSIGFPDPGSAAGTPQQICAGAKQKAAAKAARKALVCHTKAAKKGSSVDPACLATVDAKLTRAFAAAEAGGGCTTTGDMGAIDALLDTGTNAIAAALRPVAGANRCAAVKLQAAGKKALAKLICRARRLRRGLAVDPACLAKAEARFMAAFAKAESRPPCLTTADAASVEGLVDDLVEAAVSAVPGPVCGNGVREPGGSHLGYEAPGYEDCDGSEIDAFCSAYGRTGCLPPGDPNPCRCCIPPAGQAAYDPLCPSCFVLDVCCDGQTPSFGIDHVTCPGTCGTSPFPTCGGTCLDGEECQPVSSGGDDACACVNVPAPRTPCDGGSDFPTCDGACPTGEQCGVDVEVTQFSQACSCFPIGVTPCGDAGYPECGGACFGDQVCQAFSFNGTENGFCACTETTPCGGGPFGMCTGEYGPGVCTPGSACVLTLDPPTCGCSFVE